MADQNHVHDGKLYVTHITVRESLFLLIARLMVIEITVTGLNIFVYNLTANIFSHAMMGVIFALWSLIKLTFVLIVLFQWLNDFYEISPKHIAHIRGVMFQHRDEILFAHISEIGIEQSLMGRVFNYGDIKLFNRELKESYVLYQIHNPHKYFQLIHDIRPDADEDSKIIREHLREKEKAF